jgi:hypothetical protein
LLFIGSLTSGWAVHLAVPPLVVVCYAGAPDGLQLAAVVPDMAAELAVGGGGGSGNELRPSHSSTGGSPCTSESAAGEAESGGGRGRSSSQQYNRSKEQ